MTADTLGTALDTPVGTTGDNVLCLLLLLARSSAAEKLGDLASLLAVVEVLRLHDTVGLPLGTLETGVRLDLFTPLGLGHLLDRAGVESTLALLESSDGLLGDGDVGAVVLGLLVKEPRGKTILVLVATVEALVDELRSSDLAVDEASGKLDGFGSVETLL